jgi:hypothetical protein
MAFERIALIAGGVTLEKAVYASTLLHADKIPHPLCRVYWLLMEAARGPGIEHR